MISNKFKNLILYNNSILEDAIQCLNRSSKKILFIIDKKKQLVGVLTDGDLRRGLINGNNLKSPIIKIMNKDPIFIKKGLKYKSNFRDILAKMGAIPVVNNDKQILDIKFQNEFSNKIPKSKTPVVIMAGGKGTRLLPFTKNIPKALVKIKGQTIIDMIISQFKSQGFNKFIVSIGHLGNKIKKYLKKSYENSDIKIEFIEEDKPLGTVGSLSLINNKSKNFIVINCDIITKLNFKNFYNFHNKNKSLLTIALKKLLISNEYGVIKIKNNKIINFKEKPSQEININSGIYIFNSKVINLLKKNSKMDLNNFLKILKNKKIDIFCYPFFEEWNEIGTLEQYKKMR